jgi:hypothetical protein
LSSQGEHVGHETWLDTRIDRGSCRTAGHRSSLQITLELGPLRNGEAGGIFMETMLPDGKVMTYSTELPAE